MHEHKYTDSAEKELPEDIIADGVDHQPENFIVLVQQQRDSDITLKKRETHCQGDVSCRRQHSVKP